MGPERTHSRSASAQAQLARCDVIVAAALDLAAATGVRIQARAVTHPQFVADAAADLRNFPRDCWSGQGDYGRAVPSDDRQTMVALDLEGVLVPEIWIAIAEHTGIDELRRTTRDEPDYDRLMGGRVELLERHDLTMSLIADVIASLQPLDGAAEFLHALRSRTQVVILSDTFEQFAAPLMAQLEWPTLLCHRLVVADDRVIGYRLRLADHKRLAVEAIRSLNYRVAAAGDSYNDTAMLQAADTGVLFRAPDHVIEEFPQFPALFAYDELLTALTTEPMPG